MKITPNTFARMNEIRITFAVLLLSSVWLMGHPSSALGQGACSPMDSAMNAKMAAAGGGADSAGVSSKARLILHIREGDTCNYAMATLSGMDSAKNDMHISNATVTFFVKRLFGKMPIAEENSAATDDFGVAEIPFPKDFAGDTAGTVTIIAVIEDNALTGPLEARASGKWGKSVPVIADPFPRALWEPRAPIAMILTFCILLGGVWCTYGFILSQLFHIKKGNKLSHVEA